MSLAADSQQILDLLRRARRRLIAQRLLLEGCRWTMYAVAGGAVWMGILAPPGSSRFPSAGATAGAAAIFATALLGYTWTRRPSLQDTAREVDTRIELSERTQTALDYIEARDAIAALLRRDALHRMRRAPLERAFLVRPRVDRREASICAIVAALSLLIPTWSGHPGGVGALQVVVDGSAPGATTPDAEPGVMAPVVPPSYSETRAEPRSAASAARLRSDPEPPTPRTPTLRSSPGRGPAAGDGPSAGDRDGSETPSPLQVVERMIAAADLAGASLDEQERASTPIARGGGTPTRGGDAETDGPRRVDLPAPNSSPRDMPDFSAYAVPLRLRAYVRDYLLGIATRAER